MVTKIKNKKKVFVAMSGGVDSSVAAALLKQEGCDVVGVFMKNWTEPVRQAQGAKSVCPQAQDEEDARKVAAKLNIPFYTFNFEKEYKKKVVDYMVAEYKVGRTPNPDIMCNSEIKFKLFLEKALKLGADYVATGHYAQVKSERLEAKSGGFKIIFKLYKGKDNNKDQSYFLLGLNQTQLKYCLFPIGSYKKEAVRKLAKKFRLHNAEKKDSQGICFVGKVSIKDFLSRYIKPKKGKIMTLDGKVIGEHTGVFYYTIGQRHGLNIGGGKPFFIARKDAKKNIIYVSNDRGDLNLYSQKLIVSKINWVSGVKEKMPLKCSASIRYRQEPAPAIIKKIGKNYIVGFLSSQWAPAEGQSIAIYKKNELMGGGVIENIDSSSDRV